MLSLLDTSGGVADLLAFDLDVFCLDFFEKIPAVQVWYLRRLWVEGLSGAVFGRAQAFSGGAGTANISVKGSSFSCLGVGVGEGSLPCVDQKCFFLGGGLPADDTMGEPVADRGLFGMLNKLSES